MSDVLTRGIEQLRQCQVDLAALPAVGVEAEIECPKCGVAMELRKSTRGDRFFVWHPKAKCRDSEAFWHLTKTTRAEAESEFQEFYIATEKGGA